MDYVNEVSNHLYEAYNLNRFISLPFLDEFGPSKNIFYNFYLYLTKEEEGYENMDYLYFLQDLLNTDDSLPANYFDFVGKTNNLILDILEYMNINIINICEPDDFLKYKKDYDLILGVHPKSNNARENDLRCMYHLSDGNNFYNKETQVAEKPYLVTLDTTFLKMRKKIYENYHRTYWYIYPPIKFANTLSTINLKLDSKKINFDIICMAETNFKASNDELSMLDIISCFFPEGELNGKTLIRQIAKLKTQEKSERAFEEFTIRNNNNQPIDVVLNLIHRHYRNKGINQLEKISKLFDIEQLSEQILKLLRKGCDMVLRNNTIDNDIYVAFDKLVSTNIEK